MLKGQGPHTTHSYTKQRHTKKGRKLVKKERQQKKAIESSSQRELSGLNSSYITTQEYQVADYFKIPLHEAISWRVPMKGARDLVKGEGRGR